MFWYEEDVKLLELLKANVVEQPQLVFYGSSSIRMWNNLSNDFGEFHPINLGFGGSTMAACVWFFDRIMVNLQPKGMIVYAGDNDLGDGRHPEEVFIFFKQLIASIRKNYGNIPVGYISIKPSILRFNIIEQIKFTNKIIAEEIENPFGTDPNDLPLDTICNTIERNIDDLISIKPHYRRAGMYGSGEREQLN